MFRGTSACGGSMSNSCGCWKHRFWFKGPFAWCFIWFVCLWAQQTWSTTYVLSVLWLHLWFSSISRRMIPVRPSISLCQFYLCLPFHSAYSSVNPHCLSHCLSLSLYLSVLPLPSLPLCLPLPHCLSLAHFLPSSTNLRSLPLSFLLWTWTNAIWFLELQQRLASTSNPFNPPTLIFHHHNICRYVPSLQTSTASLTEQSTHWQFTIPAKPTCLFIVWTAGESPRNCTLRRTLQPLLSQSRRLRRCSLAGHLLPWNTMSRDLLELQAKAGLAQKLLAAAVMVTLVDSLLSIVLC